MRGLLILTVLALSTTAAAETRLRMPHPRRAEPAPEVGSRLRLGTGEGTNLDRVRVALHSARTSTRAIVSMTLSTTRRASHEGLLHIAVPAGTQVTSLAITLDKEQRIAHLVSATTARTEYDAILSRATDPAVLEWVGESGGQAHLRLCVFPMTRGEPVPVEIIMTIPTPGTLVFDPGAARVQPRVDLELNGAKGAWTRHGRELRVVLAEGADAVTWMPPLPEVAHVDPTTSLFFGEPVFVADVPPPPPPRAGPPHAPLVFDAECLNNPIAPSCM